MLIEKLKSKVREWHLKLTRKTMDGSNYGHSNFVSITSAEDWKPYVPFLNHTIGTTVELHCKTQRSRIDQKLVGPCSLYRWFYEPRTFELTCVCVAHGEKFANGTLLLKIDKSLGIPAINQMKFTAIYQLKIWTLSDPVQIARDLFSGAATNAVTVIHASCSPIPNESSAYYCATGHCNEDLVTWEYPENWSGPVRYLRNIAYNASETTVHVLGIYWPEGLPISSKQLYVDTAVLVEADTIKICERFLTSVPDKSITKCRVEFLEQTLGYKPAHLARLNLLMSAEFAEGLTTEERVLHFARRLKPIEQVCTFPVNIQEKTASYVPSNTVMDGKSFEFLVTFRKSRIMWWSGSKPNTAVICQKLKNISEGMIETCTKVTTHGDHGFADVLFVPTTTSLWEAQIRLMTQLNLKNKRRCNFNVAVKPITKGY